MSRARRIRRIRTAPRLTPPLRVHFAVWAVFVLIIALGSCSNLRAQDWHAPSEGEWRRMTGHHGIGSPPLARRQTPRRSPEVRAWRQRAPEPVPSYLYRETGVCHASLAVVGDQALTEAGAKDAARKAWMQETRFRHGERAMASMVDESFACTRSSIGEVAGATMHRCLIKARPCDAPLRMEGR